MKRLFKGVVVAVAVLICAIGVLKGTVLIVQTGSWAQEGMLSNVRASASAALLQDGRILVTGGDPGTGPDATADLINTDGTVAIAPQMTIARSKHVSVTLQDGRVLVAGGVSPNAPATNTAEIFDPAANPPSWTPIAAGMLEGRAGATAGLLADGRVVIAGGQGPNGISQTIEIFDPATMAFALAGSMTSPRMQHAMAILQDGRVLIVGGSNGSIPVASTDIFDPVAGTVTGGPALATARFGHSATTLLNGQLIVIGGNNGNTDPTKMDVTPAELFDPAAGTFTALATNLATPREGHVAFLLPNNNNVLILGGSSAGTVTASSELFSQWQGTFTTTRNAAGNVTTLATARNNATGAANQVNAPASTMQRNGVLLVAGGTDGNSKSLSSTEAFGFATVQTNQGDYPPGTTVTITGSGWQPGEAVTLTLVESPLIDTHGPYNVTADANGNISDSSFITDLHDLDTKFTLTAVGAVSQAQNTFTDANTADSGDGTMSVSPTSVSAGGAGNTLTFLFTGEKSNSHSFDQGSIITVTIPSGWTAPQTSSSGSPGFVGNQANGTGTSCSPGLPTVSGRVITVPQTCTGSTDTFTFKYNNAAAQLNAGTATFSTASREGSSGSATSLTNGSPTVTVNPGPVSASTSTVGASPASVAADGSTLSTVTVTLLDANNNPVSNKTVSLTAGSGSSTISAASGSSSASGMVTFTVKDSTVQNVAYTAKDTSDGTTIIQTANVGFVAVGTTTSVSPSPNPSTYGSPVTFTTMVVAASGVNTPTGSVTIKDGATTICTLGLSGSGGTATGSCSVGGLTAGTHSSITGTYNGAGSFSGSASTAVSETINPKALTYTGLSVAASQVYSGMTNAAPVSGTATLQASELFGSGNSSDGKPYTGDVVSITGSPTGTYNSKDVATAATVTFGGVSLTGAASGNYTLAALTQAATITAKALTITGLTASAKVYDGTATEPLAGTPALLTAETAGTGSTSDGAPYSIDSVTAGGAPSGAFLDRNVGTTKPITVTGVTIVGAGSGNYTATQQTGLTANITAKSLTITGSTAAARVYDGTATELLGGTSALLAAETAGTGTTADGKPYSVDAVTAGGSATGAFADRNVGTSKPVTVSGVTITGTGNGNYTATQQTGLTANITAKALTIAGLSVPPSKPYDATTSATVSGTAALQATEAPGTGSTTDGNPYNVDSVSLSGIPTAAYNSQNVSAATTVTISGLSLIGAGNGNYSLTSLTQSATITPATLTYTATPASRTYNAANSTFAGTVTGFISPDTLANATTGLLTWTSPATTASDAGSYAINGSGLTANGGNYNFQQAVGNATALTINQATPSFSGLSASQSITYGTATITVGGMLHTANGLVPSGTVTVTVDGSSGMTSSFSGNPGNFSVTIATNLIPAAPTAYTITYSYPGNTNFSSASDTSTTLTVNKAALAINAKSTGKTYGQTVTFAGTEFTTSGLLNSDSVTSVTLTSAGAAANAAVAGSPYSIVPSSAVGTGLSNYSISYNNGSLTVSGLSVTASITANDKSYDGTTAATIASCTIPGKIGSDDVACGVPSGDANFASANASANPQTVTATGILLTGATAGNYTLSSTTATTTAKIHQATATISVTPYNVNYNAAAHTASGTATGAGGVNLIADVNLTGTTHTNAATYATDPWTFHDATGNYADANGTVSDVIEQAAASIFVTPYIVNYDGNPHMASGMATGVGGVNLIADLNLIGTAHTSAGTYATDPWSFHDASGNYADAVGTVSDLIKQAASATALVSSLNPSFAGQQVTFTATVTSVAGVPSGTVNFYDGANLIGSGALAVIAGNDVASFSTSTLSITTHNVTAQYASDSNFAASTSNSVQQVVNSAVTTTTILSSANPSNFGVSVSFTATAAAQQSGLGTPTGTVQFVIDGRNFGAAVPMSGGTASVNMTTLAAGEHVITAVYSGDGDFTASTSAFLIQTVNNPLKSIAVTPATPTIYVTGSQQFTATGTFADLTSAMLPGGGMWTAGNSLTSAVRAPMSAAGSNGILYFFGGQDAGGAENFVQSYNPASGAWGSGTAIPTARYQGTAAAPGDGKIYVIGGWNGPLPTNVVQAYDPGTDTWTAKAAMGHLSACSVSGEINGKIYVLTGCNGNSGYFGLLDVYDPVANTWTSLPAAPNAHGSGAGGVFNGKLYVAGGYDGGGTARATLDVYDPQANAWTTETAMPTALASAAGSVAGGKLYVVGGADNTNTLQSAMNVYDPIAKAWSSGVTLSQGRQDIGLATIDGLLYAGGGLTASSNHSNLLEVLDTDKVTWASDNLPVATIDAAAGLATGVSAGTANISATSAAYPTVSGATSLKVIQKDQIITFGALTDKTYGDPDFAVSATSNSGLTVTFIASGSCTVTGTTVHITAAGPCTITAQQAGNNIYKAASDVPQTFTVKQAGLSAAIIGNPTKLYDGNTNATLTSANFSLTGVVTGDSITVTKTSGSFNSKDVASATTVTASLASTDFAASAGTLLSNYVLPTTASGPGKITGITLSASIIGNPTKTYDGNATAALTAANFSLSPLAGTETITVTQTAGTYNSANVAAATTVTASLALGDFTAGAGTTLSNYVLPTTASGPGSISKAHLTVAADNKYKTYDGSVYSPFTATITGFVNGEMLATSGVSGSASFTGVATTAVNAGTYTITPTTGTLTAANYDFPAGNFLNGTLTINKAHLTVTADDQSKTYDGSPFTAFTAKITGFVNSENSGVVSGAATISGTAIGATDAGSYTITPLVGTLSATNYDFPAANFVSGTLTINKASSTTTVRVLGGVTFTYDGNAHPATVTVTGAGGLSLSPAPVYSCGHAPIDVSDSGCTASYSFRGDNNHTSSSDSKTYTISQANANITVNGYTGVYDGNAHGASGSATGVKGEDLSSLLSLGASFTDVPGGTANWSFAGNIDYKSSSGTASIAISQASAIVTVNGYTGVYDGNSHGATGSAKGVKGEDLSGLLNLGASFTDVPGGTANWSFAGNIDYKSSSGTASIAISQASANVTVTGHTGVYDGNSHGASGSATGVKGEDLSSLLNLGASFTDVPGGTANWSFAGNTDYKPSSGVATIAISQANANINVVGYAGAYDGNPHGASGAATGVKGENLSALLNFGMSYIGVPGGPANWLFAGNTDYKPAGGVVTIAILQASTATSVVSSSPSNTSTFMQLVTFTATVTPQFAGTTPTGAVTFYSNGVVIGTGTLTALSPDQATLNISTLSDSTYPAALTITAIYGGDGNFTSSNNNTAPMNQFVEPAPNANVNPMAVSFGNQNVNTQSNQLNVTLSNGGDAVLTPITIGLGGDDPGDFIETTNCPVSLAPGKNCTITVSFKPVDTGSRNAVVIITDNDDDSPNAQQFVSLTGSGLSTIKGSSFYTEAVFATANGCGSITESGGSTIDSFNSLLGNYAGSHMLSGGNVGTNGNVTLNGGKSAIYGTAAVDFATTGNCSKTSVTGVSTSGGAQVSGGTVALNGPVTYPNPPAPNPAPPTTTQNISGSCGSISTCTNNGTKNVILAPGQYGNLNISGGTTAHFSKGTYNLNSLTLSGQSILYVDSGPVLVNLAGASLSGGNPAMDASGGSIENPSGYAANLQFSYAGSRGLNLNGGAQAYATVYAPNALVNMSGGTDFFGSIIGSTVTSSGGTAIHYDSNLPNIQAGDYIWFSAVVNNVNGLPVNGSQVKLYSTTSTITFTAGGTTYNIPVPNAVVTFNSSSESSGAKTIYDLATSRWSTNVAKTALTGNTFVTGVAFQVPAGGFPTGIQNVAWSTSFSTDSPGVNLQWQWGAAVYSSFSTTYATASPANSNVLGVNPEDGSADAYLTDSAGAPENYKGSVMFGGTGGGLTNYTGNLSTGAVVVPTIAPMSVSPNSLAFYPQTQLTTSASMTAVLTNNDAAADAISGITIAGTNAGDFALVAAGANNCVSTPSLASGASCTLYVTFRPTDVGTRTAKIVIVDQATNSPQTVYLSGTGN